MNRLLLACDDYILIYNGNFYSNIIDPDFYNRYLRIFDQLRVVARTKIVFENPEKRYIKIDNPNIEFFFVPFFQGPNQFIHNFFKVKKRLKNVTYNCNAAILRLPSTTAFQVWKEVKSRKLPYAIEVVSCPYDAKANTNKILHKIFYNKWHKDLLKACAEANGVSYVTKEYLQTLYAPNTSSFTSFYSSLSLESNFYSSYREFPHKKTFSIVHIANKIKYNGEKGHKELIKAIAIVNELGLNVNVNFLGAYDDNDIKKLIFLATNLNIVNKIHFYGYIESKNIIFEYLKKSDLFVLPTKFEGLPRVLIEAMSVGLPCISTNLEGIKELIQPQFLIPDINDINMLAQMIMRILSDSNEYESASRYNFENSLNYESHVLQMRRDLFYLNLKKCIK